MKIKEFAQVINGSTPSSKNPQYYDGDIVWFTPKDLATQNKKYVSVSERTISEKGYKSCSTSMLPPGSVLMSSRAPIGLLAITTVPCCTNQGFKSFILDTEKCNPEYLYYYLKYHIKEIESLGSGTTFKEVSKPSIEEYEVDLPSLEKQKKTIEILSIIDSKIQNNNKQIQTLESLAKTIYDYWFVQFDFPNEDGKPYKSSGGKMVWNEELKREIPAGWEKSFFNQLVSSQVSGDWGKESIINNHKHQIYCIRGTDFASINSSENSDIPVRYILEKNLDKRLSYGDIIIEVSGGSPTQSTGRISYITNDLLNRFDKPVLVSNFCKALRLKEPKDVFWFYHTWSRLYSSGVFFNFESKTTGIKNLMLDPVLTDLGVVIPPVFYREKFYKLVAPFYSRIQKIKSENQQLFSLKVYLLPLLMNGQVKVGKESA